ncbi:2-hydroxymuconate tautomerase [Ottowia thiooxydans]|uniref:2-hydroxymuconate tautomerase n=1 Tax=Ottowia thiooxydans TaxID=219182 RepID=UPI00048F0C3A|nr:2-hydroxymuconate tautomerase [Ottowia thiooxydans]
MPTVRVEMLSGRTPEQKKALATSLTQVMVDTAGVSPASVHVIFTDIDSTDWAVAGEMLSDRSKNTVAK